jgi:hypothetical protein
MKGHVLFDLKNLSESNNNGKIEINYFVINYRSYPVLICNVYV